MSRTLFILAFLITYLACSVDGRSIYPQNNNPNQANQNNKTRPKNNKNKNKNKNKGKWNNPIQPGRVEPVQPIKLEPEAASDDPAVLMGPQPQSSSSSGITYNMAVHDTMPSLETHDISEVEVAVHDPMPSLETHDISEVVVAVEDPPAAPTEECDHEKKEKGGADLNDLKEFMEVIKLADSLTENLGKGIICDTLKELMGIPSNFVSFLDQQKTEALKTLSEYGFDLVGLDEESEESVEFGELLEEYQEHHHEGYDEHHHEGYDEHHHEGYEEHHHEDYDEPDIEEEEHEYEDEEHEYEDEEHEYGYEEHEYEDEEHEYEDEEHEYENEEHEYEDEEHEYEDEEHEYEDEEHEYGYEEHEYEDEEHEYEDKEHDYENEEHEYGYEDYEEPNYGDYKGDVYEEPYETRYEDVYPEHHYGEMFPDHDQEEDQLADGGEEWQHDYQDYNGEEYHGNRKRRDVEQVNLREFGEKLKFFMNRRLFFKFIGVYCGLTSY